MLFFFWLAALQSSVPASADLFLDAKTGAVTGGVQMHVAKGARLQSYLQALKTPYQPNDVDRLWDYPGAPEGSRFVWQEVSVDGHAVDPQAPLPEGLLRARFSAVVPRRYGALGEVDGAFTLVAPLPFVTIAARAVPVDWALTVKANGDGKWLEPPPRYAGDPSRLLLAFSRRGFETVNGDKSILRFAKRPRVMQPHDGWPLGTDIGTGLEFSAEDELVNSFHWAQKTLARYHVPALRWLVAPLRREPGVCSKDAVVISREVYRATPAEVLYKFHRMAITRVAFGCALERAFGIDAEDADALAWFLIDVDAKDVAEGNRSAKSLLRPFEFIPDVDSLMYAPQMPWAGVYFSDVRAAHNGDVHDVQNGPPEPDDFFHERPRGKIFYDKLLARLGEDETNKIFRRALAEHRGPRSVASEQHSEDVREIVSDFFGPYPQYDVKMAVHGDGPGLGSVHVEKIGPGKNAREPIDVEVVTAEGKTERQRTYKLSDDLIFLGAPFKKVRIDPDEHLLELYAPTSNDPRFDDTTSHRWRFTLTQIAASFGFSASELSAGIDFSLRREYDLHHAFGMGASYDPSGVYATLHYDYFFGHRITPDQLGFDLGVQASFERLTEGFAGATTPVYVGGGAVYLGYDDRPAQRTAMRGFGFNSYLGVGVPLGRPTYVNGGIGLLKIVQLRYDQGLVFRLRGDATVGDAPIQAEFPLGGRFNARGFPEGELTRPQRLLGSIEWRHELGRGFRTNLADIVWIDGIEGAAFADGVFLGDDKTPFFSYANFFYDVGYGIRLLYDQGGVNPGVLALDFGFPLKRYDPTRPPVSIFLDFVQSFAAF